MVLNFSKLFLMLGIELFKFRIEKVLKKYGK